MKGPRYDENGVMTHSHSGNRVGPGPWCGTVSGYKNHNCRCQPCTTAWRVYHLAWLYAKPERAIKHRDRARAWRARRSS